MNMNISLYDLLAERGWLLVDGAIGTNLFMHGLEAGTPPELWNIEYPTKIKQLHHSFITAGADIILTNSFGGTSFRLKLHGSENRVGEFNQAAAVLACEVANQADRPVLVGGSIGPTGELFAPLGTLTPALAQAAFAAQIEALVEGGVDLIWIETMSSLEEVEAAVCAAKTTNLPIIATMTFDTAGRSMMGVDPADYANFANEIGVDGFGANCGIGPAELLDSVRRFSPLQQKNIIVAKGNCGIPVYDDGHIHYQGTPELMADYAVLARDSGAQIIGGCCGTSIAHLQAMYHALHACPIAAYPDDDYIAIKLGKPWKNLPSKPSTETTSRTTKKRRRRSK